MQELADQFRVSWGYSKKIRTQQLQTGQKERPVQSQHGPLSRVTDAVRADLRAWLQVQPDLTEMELRDRLATRGVGVCKSRVGQILREMGLGRKKNRSMRRSETAPPISNGAPSLSQLSRRLRRSG